MEELSKKIIKKSYSEFKSNYFYCFPAIISFLIILIIGFALIFGFSNLQSVGNNVAAMGTIMTLYWVFIVAPYFICLVSTIGSTLFHMPQKDNKNFLGIFFFAYPLSYTKPYRNGLRLFINLFFGAAIAVILYFISRNLTYAIAYNLDENVRNTIITMNEMAKNGISDSEIQSFYLANCYYLENVYDIVSLISIILGIVYFVLKAFYNQILFFVMSFCRFNFNYRAGMVNRFLKDSSKEAGFKMKKMYLEMNFPFILSYLIVVGTVTAVVYIFTKDIAVSIISGQFVALAIYVTLIPLFIYNTEGLAYQLISILVSYLFKQQKEYIKEHTQNQSEATTLIDKLEQTRKTLEGHLSEHEIIIHSEFDESEILNNNDPNENKSNENKNSEDDLDKKDDKKK